MKHSLILFFMALFLSSSAQKLLRIENRTDSRLKMKLYWIDSFGSKKILVHDSMNPQSAKELAIRDDRESCITSIACYYRIGNKKVAFQGKLVQRIDTLVIVGDSVQDIYILSERRLPYYETLLKISKESEQSFRLQMKYLGRQKEMDSNTWKFIFAVSDSTSKRSQAILQEYSDVRTLNILNIYAPLYGSVGVKKKLLSFPTSLRDCPEYKALEKFAAGNFLPRDKMPSACKK